MTTRKMFALIAALAVGGISTAHAQAPAAAPRAATKKEQVTPSASAQGRTRHTAAAAKVAVSADSAKALVLARASGAKVESSKLRRRGGRMVYDIKVREQGQKSSHWYRVDATTGNVVDVPMAAKAHAKKS
jgi:uncharacterized membrane protein YkoI